MPSLILFNRRTILGGDELQPTCMIAICFRIFQILLLLLPTISELFFEAVRNGYETDGGFLQYFSSLPSKCINYNDSSAMREGIVDKTVGSKFHLLLLLYLLSLTACSLVNVFTDLQLRSHAYIGTPTQPMTRPILVTRLLEFKLSTLTTINFTVYIVGIIAFFGYSPLFHDQGSCAPIYSNNQHDTTSSTTNTTKHALSSSSWNVWYSWYIFILFSQTVEIFFTTVLLLLIFSTPRYSDEVIQQNIDRYNSKYDDHHFHQRSNYRPSVTLLDDVMWENRCRFFCKCSSILTCFMFGGRDINSDYYGSIARVLTDYFEHGGVLDIVPSDVIAAFIILQRKQAVNEQKKRKEIFDSDVENAPTFEISSSDTSFPTINEHFKSGLGELSSLNDAVTDKVPRLSTSYSSSSSSRATAFYSASEDLCSKRYLSHEQSEDCIVIAEGARFSRHALAIYTWMLYIYMKPCGGICKLTASQFCNGIKKKEDDLNDEENYSAPTLIGDNACNFHQAGLLQIANLNESELVYANFENGIEETPYCIVLDHQWKTVVLAVRGTLSLEDCVVDILVDSVSLEDLGLKWKFDGKSEYCHAGILACAEWIMNDLMQHKILHSTLRSKYPQYRLRIVGHSLGAGCAVLLAKMLRREFPTLRCLAYSPPGGFCTYATAIECRDYVTTFVLNSDLVPRLSVHSMEKLRTSILQIIGQISIPKMDVFRSVFQNKTDNKDDVYASFLYHGTDTVPFNTSYADQLSQFEEIQRTRKEQRSQNEVSLFPPGKIVHLIKEELQQGREEPSYIPIWAENDSFQEIVIDPTMGIDHFPNRVCRALEDVARSYGLDTRTSSAFGNSHSFLHGVEGEMI